MAREESFYNLMKESWAISEAIDKLETLQFLGCAALGASIDGFGLALTQQDRGALPSLAMLILGSVTAGISTDVATDSWRKIIQHKNSEVYSA